MNSSTFTTALLLATAAATAQADDLNTNINLGGSATELSATFGVTHVERGSFVDTFSFTPSSATYFVDASLVTLGFTPTTDVSFLSATLNGNDMVLTGPGIVEFGYLLPTPITGPLVLEVVGYVDFPGALGPASASYSGTLNISAVPEPDGYALLLSGLGMLAATASVARRRAVKLSPHAIPTI